MTPTAERNGDLEGLLPREEAPELRKVRGCQVRAHARETWALQVNAGRLASRTCAWEALRATETR